ncbi:MAG: prepilin-type N-terminal cleavage/methylation domain-containing protein [Phycisphaerae bacterium]|nr:prepilin-type N-terminal cleavage/methylation domain-containing protein [Phycisphaerae bacterium]
MEVDRRQCTRPGGGFTLIELLVVVAIIALLISILLPSLSKAREQARATLCASRIGQLVKAMMVYADDYEECPPFLGAGYGRITDAVDYPHLGSDSQTLARLESWLMPGDYIMDGFDGFPRLWDSDPWPAEAQALVREGTIYSYTRFESMYRCPEFERLPVGTPGRNNAPKTQNVFNYSRSILGRKLLTSMVQDADAGTNVMWPGPVAKLSSVYSPAALIMMLDEQWDFHCAGNYNDGGPLNIDWQWMSAETINCLVGDTVGSYHGSVGTVLPADWELVIPSKQGNLGYYDGHAALYRDAWPWRNTLRDGQVLQLIAKVFGEEDLKYVTVVGGLLFESLYAQRGINFTLQMAVDLAQQYL